MEKSSQTGTVPKVPGATNTIAATHYVDEVDLERKIASVLSWSKEQRMAIGAAAREWYVENDRGFKRRFVDSIKDIIEGR